MNDRTSPEYVPALGFHSLTRFYDAVMARLLRERAFKGRLVEETALAPGLRVLDVGCGTGTLTLALKAACPGADVTGLDIDPDALAIAGDKASRAGLAVRLDRGPATALPYPAATFDRVCTSLLLHHLPTDQKLATLREAGRVLKPHGLLLVADWGRPRGLLSWSGFQVVRLLDGLAATADHAAGRFAEVVREADFGDVGVMASFDTLFGTVQLLRASTTDGVHRHANGTPQGDDSGPPNTAPPAGTNGSLGSPTAAGG